MSEVILTKPQLASSEIPDIYTQVSWPKYIQPKYDGICCLAVNGVAMSRTMKPIPNKYIQEQFTLYNLHGLHGELVTGLDFNDTQSFVMSADKLPEGLDIVFKVYDMWNLGSSYTGRWCELGSLMNIHKGNPFLEVTPTHLVESPSECEYFLDAFIRQGYEGAMLRDPNSLYKQGRHTLKSQSLMKLKKFYDDEAVIIGFEEKMHNTNEQELDERGYAKRSHKQEGMVPADTLGALVVKWKDVEFKIGSGYNDQQRQEIWDNRGNLLGKLVTFKYQSTSSYGVARFPIFKCIREEYNQ